jgi:hypothetical protein
MLPCSTPPRRRLSREEERSVTQTCSVADCTDRVYARGWCVKHYHRWYKHGSLEMPASRIPNPGPCAIPDCTRPGPFARG